jgi:hypothetical protein
MVLHTSVDCGGVLDTGASVLEAVAQSEKGHITETTKDNEQWDSVVRANNDINKFGWLQSGFFE